MTAGLVVLTTTCPVCDEQLTSLTESNKPVSVGANKIETHIRSTTGEGHGPRGTVPNWVTIARLRSYVETAEAAAAP